MGVEVTHVSMPDSVLYSTLRYAPFTHTDTHKLQDLGR